MKLNKKTLLSIALGLTLAYLFYQVACSGGQCLVVKKKSPRADTESKVHIDTDGTCYRFDRHNTYCHFPIETGHTDYVPGGGHQDPGYYDGNVIQHGGSIGASYEGFEGKNKMSDTAGMMLDDMGIDIDPRAPRGVGKEGFTADCLGLDGLVEYPQTEFNQIGCRPEPKWNLPRDARMERQPMYPCGVPGQCNEAKCHKHHPMDSIYQPPNEGVMTRQVRN